MPRVLLRAANDANEVVAGLQVFFDSIPHDADLDDCISELLALGRAIRELAEQHPDYWRVSERLTQDVALCIKSLNLTLEHVKGMFGETRHRKYDGDRPYRRAWEDLADYFVMKEGGPSLISRLETYDIFMQSILNSLKGRPLEADVIKSNRRRIELILKSQLPLEEAIAGFMFEPPLRPPLPHLQTFPFPSPQSMSPVWSDESDSGIFPPAPEPPNPWGSPISPTMSNASGSTWASNSSAARAPVNHWATKVFDGLHSRTPLKIPGDEIQCYGREESPGVIQRLASENFLEVLRLPLDATNFYVRLYWRPSNHRARMLCSRKEASGVVVNYCIPLTALKLTRSKSKIILWRWDDQDQAHNLYAVFSFRFYEPLLLFYCAFTAMKSQDHKPLLDVLQDNYHVKDQGILPEKAEFAASIKDDNYLHALRVYRDKDSGCMRLEARALRGAFTHTPIWTAFINKPMRKKEWIRPLGAKTLQLSELKPYVFCPGYSPPRSKSGKFKLQFTKPEDADSFKDVIQSLAMRYTLPP